MSSHDIRIIIEHYANGGFGVIGDNYQVMGISDSEEIGRHTKDVMLKELNKLKLDKIRQKEIGDDSQQPRMKQTRGGELKSDEGLHSTDNGSPADIVSKEDSEDICICGHHTKDHSYDPNKLDADLECDICDCKRFKTKEDRSFLGSYAEFWDNPEDDRWDKEYNPDLLPETLKNKEEKTR